MSSQDHNRNIHFSSSQDFFQKLTPASSERGISLTPVSSSSAMQQNDLSSSWCSQSHSQQTPKSLTKSFLVKQNNTKDTLFLNEIRFCLHAVLSVVRDLPEKLRLLVANSCKTTCGNGEVISEKEKKELDDKLTPLKNILSFSEKLFENSLETKKFQDHLLLDLNEVQKYVAINQKEFNIFKEYFDTKNNALTKYIMETKKSCLGRISEIKSVLDSLKSCVTKLRLDELETKILGLIDDVKRVHLKINTDENIINVLITQEKENANKLDKLLKEVDLMKCALKNLPSNFSSILKMELAGVCENTTYIKQNIRFPEPVSGTGTNNFFTMTQFPKRSPVARVAPRIMEVPLNRSERTYLSDMSEKYGTSSCKNPDTKFHTSLKLIEFENNDTLDFPVLKFNRPLKRKLGRCSAYSTPDQNCLKVFRRE